MTCCRLRFLGLVRLGFTHPVNRVECLEGLQGSITLSHTLYQGMDQRPGALADVPEGPGGVERLPGAHGRLRGRRHLVILYTAGGVKEDDFSDIISELAGLARTGGKKRAIDISRRRLIIISKRILWR